MNIKTFCLIQNDKMKRIPSKKHRIGTYDVNKLSLSCFDDKRFILDDVFIHLLIFIKIFRCKI